MFYHLVCRFMGWFSFRWVGDSLAKSAASCRSALHFGNDRFGHWILQESESESMEISCSHSSVVFQTFSGSSEAPGYLQAGHKLRLGKVAGGETVPTFQFSGSGTAGLRFEIDSVCPGRFKRDLALTGRILLRSLFLEVSKGIKYTLV